MLTTLAHIHPFALEKKSYLTSDKASRINMLIFYFFLYLLKQIILILFN
jgi:hypothetical protein